MIDYVRIRIQALSDQPLYACHPVVISFQTDQVIDSKKNLEITIFTEHLCPVLHTEMNSCDMRRKDMLFFKGICKVIDYPWLPGRYFMLVSQKGQWYERVSFSVNHNFKVTIRSVGACLPGSEYRVLSDLAHEHTSVMQSFFSMPASYDLKRRVLQILKYRNYEAWSEVYAVPSYSKLSHLVIASPPCCNDAVVRGFVRFVSISTGCKCEFVDCSTLYDKTRMDPYEGLTDLISRLSGTKMDSDFLSNIQDDEVRQTKLLCLSELDFLLQPQGNYIARQLSRLDDHCVLVLVGSKGTLTEVLPMLRKKVGTIPESDFLALGSPLLEEALSMLMLKLAQCYDPTPEAQDKLVRVFQTVARTGQTDLLTYNFVDQLVTRHILPRYVERINMLDVNEFEDKKVEGIKLSQLQPFDIDLCFFQQGSDSYQDCMKELDAMVGLQTVKDDIRSTANRMRFLMERREHGLPSESLSNGHHIVLTGSPGTGKTTVACLLGRIYHQIGLISKGDVVVAERSKIVGEFIGQTEQNMQMILSRAKGNVLFIDEAYSLFESSSGSRDYGKRAIECLLTVLSQPDPDILVILAGYEQPMMELLQSNPGLPSRFPYHFHFPDYSSDELMEICDRLLSKQQYIVSEEVRKLMHNAIRQALAHKDEFFGNGRWVHQFIFDAVVPAMADRLAFLPRPQSREQLQTILPCDVEKAVKKMLQHRPSSNPRPKIVGFGVQTA